MLNLKDGTLWQWDTGRKIVITLDEGHTIDKIQFYNGIGDIAHTGNTTIENGVILANIPNTLLQYANNLTVYLMTTDEDGIKTQEQITLVVNKRAKPEDYIFEDDEIRTYQIYDERLTYLEENIILEDDIEKAVSEEVAEQTENLSRDLGVVEVTANKALHKANVNKNTLGYSRDNLLPYPHANTTRTAYGVTYTDNGDGTITASGTSTGAANFMCKQRTDNNFKLPKGRYILSGCPEGGSSTTYEIQLGYSNDAGSYVDIGREHGKGLSFEITETIEGKPLQVLLAIKNGTTVENLTFEPMIRLASDEDNTYRPYRKDVDERLIGLEGKFPAPNSLPKISVLPNLVDGMGSSDIKYWKNPFDELHFHLHYVVSKELLGSVVIGTLPEGYRPSTNFDFTCPVVASSSSTNVNNCLVSILTDGKVQITASGVIPVLSTIICNGVMK